VVSFGHGSDEEQEVELVVELGQESDVPHAEEVVELLQGSEPHEVELVVVCRLMASMSRAARARLGRAELTANSDKSTCVGRETAVETA